MADDLAGEMIVWSHGDIQERFKRSYRVASPSADVSDKGPVALDARVAADMQLPLHANVRKIGDTSSLASRSLAQLIEIGTREGVPVPPAVGASGYVMIGAAAGGTTILAGDEIKVKNSGARYRCAKTALYGDGQLVLLTAIDVGPGTDQPAGTKMEWSNPRPGCSVEATVWSEGLTGWRDEATADEYRALIEERRGNPSAAGNDAAYQALIEDATANGVAVQKAFTWPAIKGSGTTAFTFTMRPTTPGGSRLPSQAQLAIVLAALEGSFPRDDGIFGVLLAEQSTEIQIRATWRKNAAPWTDANPWPTFIAASTPVRVDGAVTISSGGFRVTTDGTLTAPVVGQTLGLYDAANATFVQKRIAGVTEVVADKSWDLTFDMSAGASDVFTPADGALVSPWSDSLNLITGAIVAYFDAMGPGELVATFYDPGRRQRRQPENPESWPSEISNRIDALVQAVSAVRSATLVSPATLEPTQVGVSPSLAYLRRLTDLACYPES